MITNLRIPDSTSNNFSVYNPDFLTWGDFEEAWTLGVKYKEMFSYAQCSSYFVCNIRIEKVFIKSKYRRNLHKRS